MADDQQPQEIRFWDIVAYEKTQMPPVMFVMSYVLAPLYGILSLALLVAFGVLMDLDEVKYLVPGLMCLGGFALLSAALLAAVPFVRRKVIADELRRYDFDTSGVEAPEVWDFSTEDFSLRFDRFGMYVNGQLIYYNHLCKQVITSNHCQRVGIYLLFALSENRTVTLPVNPVTLKMLQTLEIKLENQQNLDHILSNKKRAFEQIFNKGYVSPDEQHPAIKSDF